MKKLLNIIFAVVIILGLLLAGCQKTPDNLTVVNKGKNSLEKKIGNSENENIDNTKLNIPSDLSDQFGNGKTFEVNIEAKISTPNTTKYPVQITVPSDITQDEADNLINIFYEGNNIYNQKPQDIVTKEDIMKQVNEMKEFLNTIQKEDPERYEVEKDDWNGYIETAIESLKSAPDNYVYTISNGEFSKHTEQVNTGIDTTENRNLQTELLVENIAIEGESINGSRSFLNISKTDDRIFNTIAFYTPEILEPSGIVIQNAEQATGTKTTMEEAKKYGEKLLAEIGFSDMKAVRGIVRPEGIKLYSFEVFPEDIMQRKMYYQIFFTKVIDNIPWGYINKNNPEYVTKEEFYGSDEFEGRWQDEYISMVINDEGVINFAYVSPSDIKGRLCEDSQLLTFDKVIEILKKQFEISNAWIETPGVEYNSFYITDIKLEYAKIKRFDTDDEYLLVPAWNFYGYSSQRYKDGMGDISQLNDDNEYEEINYFSHSYLTINAIDGSVISPVADYS